MTLLSITIPFLLLIQFLAAHGQEDDSQLTLYCKLRQMAFPATSTEDEVVSERFVLQVSIKACMYHT